MSSERISSLTRMMDGLAFAADAWREAWGVQVLAAAGLAMMVTAWLAQGLGGGSELFAIGAAVSLVAWSPLFGALLRIELTRPEVRRLGLYGLQIGPLELRLWGLVLTTLCATVLAVLLAVAALTAIFVLFQGEGRVGLGPFGEMRTAFLAAAVVIVSGLIGYLWALVRLSLAPVLTAAGGRLVWSESWERTAGRTAELVAARLAALAPSLLLLTAAALFEGAVDAGGSIWRGGAWPLFDAVLFGLFAGCVLSFVQAPVLVAVLGGFHGSLGSRRRNQATKRLLNRPRPEPFPS